MKRKTIHALFAVILAVLFAVPIARADSGLPDETLRDMLIVNTLLRLNDANRTGNYAILRDLASRQFKDEVSLSKIEESFKSFRDLRLWRDEVSVRDFAADEGGEILHEGILRLSGSFTLSRFRLNYLLRFKREDGEWKLFSLGATTEENK